MENKLNDPEFGSAKQSDPYKQTRETLYSSRERRFQKKLERELKRGGLSNQTKNELLSGERNAFLNKILEEKKTVLSALNSSEQQTPTVQKISSETNQPTVSSQNISESKEPPSGISQKSPSRFLVPVDICKNGIPHVLYVYTMGDPIPRED